MPKWCELATKISPSSRRKTNREKERLSVSANNLRFWRTRETALSLRSEPGSSIRISWRKSSPRIMMTTLPRQMRFKRGTRRSIALRRAWSPSLTWSIVSLTRRKMNSSASREPWLRKACHWIMTSHNWRSRMTKLRRLRVPSKTMKRRQAPRSGSRSVNCLKSSSPLKWLNSFAVGRQTLTQPVFHMHRYSSPTRRTSTFTQLVRPLRWNSSTISATIWRISRWSSIVSSQAYKVIREASQQPSWKRTRMSQTE